MALRVIWANFLFLNTPGITRSIVSTNEVKTYLFTKNKKTKKVKTYLMDDYSLKPSIKSGFNQNMKAGYDGWY